MVILYGSFVTPFVIMFLHPGGGSSGHSSRSRSRTRRSTLLGDRVDHALRLGREERLILLVDYANTLRKRGLTYVEAIFTAGGTRLRPIVMTTAAMVFGMLPLATGTPKAARFASRWGSC